MEQLLTKYAVRLQSEGTVRPGRAAIACKNDSISAVGPEDLASLAVALLDQLSATAIVIAEPVYPYANLLLKRSLPDLTAIIPNDSESRASLHDIPLIALSDNVQLTATIASVLCCRKGCIVEGVGIAAQGTLTVEQAYIAWSSLYHATFIKYHEDLLRVGQKMPEETAVLAQILQHKQSRCPLMGSSDFQAGPLFTPREIIKEIAAVGRATVEHRLVDSFFGNISYAGPDALYISQTSARLDELEHQIDAVPYENISTAGITASSELPAHRALMAATGCRAILHGHPRLPVVMSFFSSPTEFTGIDQVCGIPVVGGEGGLGGLAETVPRAFAVTQAKAVIVRGHGVFSVGRNDFRDAFAALLSVEEDCRMEYCRRLAGAR